MAYPYTDEEIQEIFDRVGNLLFGWITNGITSQMAYDSSCRMCGDWSDQNKFWDPVCMYGEKYSPVAKSRGLCRDMLSLEQRAIACSLIKQATARAREFLQQSPKIQKYRQAAEKEFREKIKFMNRDRIDVARLSKSELQEMKEAGRLNQLSNMLDMKFKPIK